MNLLFRLLLLNGLLLIGSQAVLADEPVARWDFGAEEQTPLKSHGGVHRDVEGPRPPVYPDFSEHNTAVRLDGNGSRFTFADPGANSPFDFTNGDEITLEAWVNLRELRDGENRYIIGKGRTGRPGFAGDNQNWALRVTGSGGKACVNFLFASQPTGRGGDAHWHRWTTNDGFVPRTGWHHVAVAYRFGEPESIQAWLNGQRLSGRWDMGGPTKQPPVNDDDEIWIGSSMGGSAAASWDGGLDAIAIHRRILDEETFKKRYRRVGEITLVGLAPAVMPQLGPLPNDRVIVTFHQDFPAHDRWLMEDESWPIAAARWEGDAFLLNQIPLRYDDWGLRTSWKAPVVVRMAADVDLPAGEQTILFRARGLARLWVDGQLVGTTQPLTGSPDGEEPITPVSAPPAPGHRPKWHREQEVIGTVKIEHDGPVRVVLEAVAGGQRFRPEPGELVVAVRSSDGQSYAVLQPSGGDASPLPLTDEAVEAKLAEISASINALNDATRRAAAASRDGYWAKRHEAAKQWVNEHQPPTVPQVAGADVHPIDAFILARIQQVKSAANETPQGEAEYFHSQVLPILRSECFRCHGDKDQGGLRLNSREAAIAGGDSGLPAIEPGDPHASELINRIRNEFAEERMPPSAPLAEEKIQILEKWITLGAKWPEVRLAADQTEVPPIVDDSAFLRRAYLDTVGVVPTAAETREFLQDASPNKRERLIERLLDDPRWADHWVSYWQDVLAENPTMLNATLNSTGPFRWFLYEAFRDDKPVDRWVTELVMMRGGTAEGGSAGFAQASQNDAPFASKGHILAGAFLGMEMQCARCHDSPYHTTTQKELFSLAAMLARNPVSVPESSTVPAGFFENMGRQSLIKVTLKPGERVTPTWHFAEITGADDDEQLRALMENPDDSRERLATLITAPQNTRFARVMVNRLWRRLIGAGIVEPPNDWEGNPPSHPELLDWLAKEWVSNQYSLKQLTKLIMTSQLYQREAVGENLAAAPQERLFNAPERRRMTAEQLVDSLYVASGNRMDVEEMTIDPDGRRTAASRNTFGKPHRSWMFVSLSNERDRPSLTFPYAAMVEEVLTAFGWSADRQSPITDREQAANVRQPAVIANSHLTLWLTSAAAKSHLAELAIKAESPDDLVDSIFLAFLTRLPNAEEKQRFTQELAKGFNQRLVLSEHSQVRWPEPWERLPQVTWSNHLRNEANTIQLEHARRVRQGPPADPRLEPEWRERYEDFVWSVVNLREFLWMP